jgi:tripartite-type tricarboxylate transporter receptor subunit TctC
MIGAELVAKSAPDGYTLLMAPTSTLCITPHVVGKAPFQAERDFAPGALTATAIALLVVANTVPARTLKELVDLARSQPGKIAYASPGPGSVPHIAGEMLKAAAGVDLLHVPYKGSGQIIPDIVAGRVATMFTPLAPVAPMIADGRLRALAVTAPKRSAALPAVPTFAESGIAGMEIEGWYAIFGPAGMQRHIAAKLGAEVARIMATEPVRARYAQLGLDPATASPDELGAMLKRDSARWAQVIRSRGIRAD